MTRQPRDPNLRKYWAQAQGFATFFDSKAERDAWIAAAPAQRLLDGPDILPARRKCVNRIPHCGGNGGPVIFLE